MSDTTDDIDWFDGDFYAEAKHIRPGYVMCPYCKRRAQLVDSKEVYDRSYGMIFLCRPCQAWVGCHKGTKRPLGRLANAELRQWKSKAHLYFDRSWRGKKKSRGRAYELLAEKLNIDQEDAHIGMFDVEQCKKVVELYGGGPESIFADIKPPVEEIE